MPGIGGWLLVCLQPMRLLLGHKDDRHAGFDDTLVQLPPL
jgi:hypothetical protein